MKGRGSRRTILFAAIVAVALACALPQSAAALQFAEPPGSPYGFGSESPSDIATGDLNGDGRTDVVTSNSGPLFSSSYSFSVLLAAPSGALAPAPGSPVAVPEAPNGVALGDFDDDGDLDIAVAGEGTPGKAMVYLNNGSGSFSAAPGPAPTAGANPSSIAAGDLNGDGVDDLAVANYASNSVSVLYSNGDGTFTPAVGNPFAVGSSPISIAIGNFNEDGLGDIATANYGSFFAGAISVLLANTAGGYAAAPGSPLEGEYQPWDIAVGKVNADDKLDLVVVNSPNTAMTVKLGNGAGEFSEPPGTPFSYPSHLAEGVALADFDGDGRDDVATAWPERSFGELPKQREVWIFDSAADGSLAPIAGNPFVPSTSPAGVATGDFNGDGRIDVAVPGGSSIAVMLNAAPEIEVDPTSVSFGNQAFGVTSAPRQVKIHNEGTAPLGVSSIEATGSADFAVDPGSCLSTPIAAGGECTVEVTFTPSALTARNGTLEIESNDSGAPLVEVPLSGTGVANPGISLTPASKNFGSRQAGTGPGPAQAFTVKSTGTTALNLGTVSLAGTAPGQFDLTADDCSGEELQPGEECEVEVAFDPTAIGSPTANLSVPSDAPASPALATLSGEGTANPGISLTPASKNFGSRQAGTGPGPAQAFTVKSTGTTALNLGTVSLAGTAPGQFDLTADDCSGEELQPGEECEVEVAFDPTAIGSPTANLSVPSDAPASPALATLEGVALANPDVSLTPASHDFGSRQEGDGPGPVQAFALKSTGTTALHVGAAALGGAQAGQFQIAADRCSSTELLPGEECTVEIAFAPTVAGTPTAMLSLPSDSPAGPATATLSGTGSAKPAGGSGDQAPPSPCSPATVRKLAPYTPRVNRKPQVPGLRARFATAAPAVVRVAATVSFRAGGRSRSASLGSRTLRVGGAFANYKLPIPANLRVTLTPGKQVTLTLRYSSKAAASACKSFGPTRTKSLATRVVWIQLPPK